MKFTHPLASWTITFLLFAHSCSLGAQTIQEAPTTRFSMSIEGNVGVSDRLFVNDGSASSFIEDVLDDIERPDIAWEAALLTEYRINHWFGVQTGIRYTRWGYRSPKEPLIWANPSPELAEASRHQQKLTFIGVPIRGTFHLAMGKTRWMAYLGWSPGLMIKHRDFTTLYYADRTETIDMGTGTNYREFNMTGEAGFGWVVPVSSALSLSFTPNIRMHTWGLYEEAALNRRLFSYGLAIGLTLH